jgi:hypothetical protein
VGVIKRHLTSGLFYIRSFKLIPALVGTIIPFFWQMVNLYGTLPAIILIIGVWQLIAAALSAIMYPLLFWLLTLGEIYCLALLFMVIAGISWLVINIITNRRAGFKMIKLQFSTRTALTLMGLLLGQRYLTLPVTPRTACWDLHLQPHLAGRLQNQDKEEIVAAIRHDYKQAAELLGEAALFGCSPGSFEDLLLAAGIKESQFIMMDTIIPPEHAAVFGIYRPFYFYVIIVSGRLD